MHHPSSLCFHNFFYSTSFYLKIQSFFSKFFLNMLCGGFRGNCYYSIHFMYIICSNSFDTINQDKKDCRMIFFHTIHYSLFSRRAFDPPVFLLPDPFPHPFHDPSPRFTVFFCAHHLSPLKYSHPPSPASLQSFTHAAPCFLGYNFSTLKLSPLRTVY